MSATVSIYAALLFFILTPGILLKLPTSAMFSKLPIKGNRPTVIAAVHALVFGLIFYLTKPIIWRLGVRLEGFSELKGEIKTAVDMTKDKTAVDMTKDDKKKEEEKAKETMVSKMNKESMANEEEEEEKTEGFLSKLFKK
jgi:hypothetical protein